MILELIRQLIIFAFIAGIGYLAFIVIEREVRSGNISAMFNRFFNGDEGKSSTIDLSEQKEGTYALPEGKQNEDVLNQLNELQEKLDLVQKENQQLRQEQPQIIQETLSRYRDRIDQQNKENILSEIFGDQPKDYARSDEFEKQEFQDHVNKKKEELNYRELKQEVDEKIFEQEKNVFDFRNEAKDDRADIRSEMRDGFDNVNQKFLHLEKDIMTLKGFVTEKFSQMETQFYKELSVVKDSIGRLRVEVKQDISDVRVQFGKEIVRLDKQQNMIVGKLQEYEAKLKGFTYDVMRIKNEAERFAIRGEDMLNKANNVYHRHRSDMKVLSKDLEVGIQQISLHKGDFANQVGQAKLLMDKISQDQYLALKDIAHERIGVSMLRQDYQQRVALEQSKMQNLIQEQRHLKERIQKELSHGRAVGQLQHRLFMTEENLRFTSNRASLVQQEFSMIQKLSR